MGASIFKPETLFAWPVAPILIRKNDRQMIIGDRSLLYTEIYPRVGPERFARQDYLVFLKLSEACIP